MVFSFIICFKSLNVRKILNGSITLLKIKEIKKNQNIYIVKNIRKYQINSLKKIIILSEHFKGFMKVSTCFDQVLNHLHYF